MPTKYGVHILRNILRLKRMYKEELANKYRGYHHYPMKIDLGN
jgi:hypothetical protein